MPLSPALQKLIDDNNSHFHRNAPVTADEDFELAPPTKIKLEIELYPGETRTITIKSE